MAVGLAVGAGYLLGRTKKAKLAFAVGTMVAGRRMKLNPASLARAVSEQLEKNPQFKEIGDQLREDLRGVGKAATGSLLDKRIESLADRLHDRTLDVQDRIAGVVPGRDEHDEPERDEPESDESGESDEDTGRKGPTAARKTRSATGKATRAVTGKGRAKDDGEDGADDGEDGGEESGRQGGKSAAPRKQQGSGTRGSRSGQQRTASKGTKGTKTSQRSTAKRAPAKKTARATTRSKGGDDA
ncbi:DNA primase [Streptomyces sp. CC224B]|uniref:DNA primase n=1 Tax=Streptomyces sp. CC224B TaxID=3044571 RepID=UPI0024A9684C|nr:DNA primase [Streptomyces sp. CC224B]